MLEPHRHSHLFQLVWISDGKYIVTIDEEEHEIQNNHFLLLYPNTIHATNFTKTVQGYSMHFSSDFFEIHSENKSHLAGIIKHNISKKFLIVKMNSSTSKEVNGLIQYMNSTYVSGSFLKDEIIRSYLHLTLLKLFEYYNLHDSSTHYTSSQVIVNKFFQAVEEHFVSKKSVAEYARNLNLSEGYLNHVVKNETGHPAGKVIRERILHEAERLLIYSDKTISEIAYQLNFNHPTYFFRMFKKYIGKTPKDFRNSYRKR
nr:helix-turn-helix domain-containing protein [Flavobacterium sp. CS20]